MSLQDFKKAFAHHPNLTHLNNAGLSPISKPARDKILYWGERFYQEGFYTDADYMEDIANSRQHLAKLIGCQARDVAWFTSTAGAINQFAFQIGLTAGDEIVMWDQEYSSMLYPFKFACEKFSAALKIVKSEDNLATPTEKYIAALGPKTKVAAFSWVQFSSGAQMDVPAVISHCKKHGILVFIDIIQGLGLHPFTFWDLGIDAVAGGSHKWLASPVGVGYLALSQDLQKTMKPFSYGSATFGTCDDPSDFACEPKTDASKFEPGSKQVLEITALGASCELIQKVGVETIQIEALRLSKKLMDGAKSLGLTIKSPFWGEHMSAMVNIILTDGKLQDLTLELKKKKINYALRGGGIRFSPHAFNSDQDIDSLLQVLKQKAL
jgi:cysteine desulfurase/selenocysteine lyase